MKYLFALLVLVLFSFNSKPLLSKFNVSTSSVSIDTLFTDKISIRAIEIDQNKIWYAGDKNRFGYFDLTTNQRIERKINRDSDELTCSYPSKQIFFVYGTLVLLTERYILLGWMKR